MIRDAELRALLERCQRRALDSRSSVYDEFGAGKESAYADIANELESLLRPQEPEQAARERLIESARHLAKQYKFEGNGVGVAAAEDRLIADVKALDAAERNRT